MKEGNVEFWRNNGHPQSYASGNKPGLSCRFHHTPSGGMFGVGKYSWRTKPTPQFLYDNNCYKSFEFTVIVRVGPDLGTHESFAFKLVSRPDTPDDTIRSTIEMNLPNDQKPNLYVNYNYAHAGYQSASGVKQYTKDGKVTVGKWIGAKVCFIIADDRKSTMMYMYINTDPIDLATGKPNNKGWTLKGEYLAKGIPQYDNVPPVWGGMTNYLRVDGYKYVDVFRFSIREIEKTLPPKHTHLSAAAIPQENIEVLEADTETNFNDFEDPHEFDELRKMTATAAVGVQA